MADLYYKSFQYRVLSTRVDEYLAIRHQADQLYRRYFDRLPTYLQSTADPYQWLELYAYEDPSTYRASVERLQADPEMDRLWRRFRTVLDSSYPPKFEEYRVAEDSQPTTTRRVEPVAAGPVAAGSISAAPTSAGPVSDPAVTPSAGVPIAMTGASAAVSPAMNAPASPAPPMAAPPIALPPASVTTPESVEEFGGPGDDLELPEAATIAEYGDSGLTVAEKPASPESATSVPDEFGSFEEPLAELESEAPAVEPPATDEAVDLDFDTDSMPDLELPKSAEEFALEAPAAPDRDDDSGELTDVSDLTFEAEADLDLPEEFDTSLTESTASEPTLEMPQPPAAAQSEPPRSLTPPQSPPASPAATTPPPAAPPAPARRNSPVETLFIPTNITLPPLDESSLGPPPARRAASTPAPPAAPKAPTPPDTLGFEPVEWEDMSLDNPPANGSAKGGSTANGESRASHQANGATPADDLESLAQDAADADFDLPDFDLPNDDSHN